MAEERDLRDLALFLVGYAYGSRKATDHVLAGLSINAWPEDVASLLGGIDKRNLKMVTTWFENRGAIITETCKAPDAALAALRAEWQRTLTRRLAGTLEYGQYSEPGTFLKRCIDVVESLKSNGVAIPTEPPESDLAANERKPEAANE